ncbi:MAG: hypothetical protein E7627_00235 [Ruminococcaceae bacterium]|nr:hypothetical protein [Oscillospiraceae bacterium]
MSNKNLNDDISMYYPDGDSEHMAEDDNSTKTFGKISQRKNTPKKRIGKLSKSHWIILAIVFVVYTVVLLVGSWLIFYRPTSDGNSTLPFETDPPDTVIGGYEKPPLSTGDEPSGTDKTGFTPKDGVYNILVVGHDKEAHLADVTMLVNFDTVNNSISIMQIPRDTYVGLDGLTTHKVNESFARFYNKALTTEASDVNLAALDQYASMFERNLCINIHHTVLMNLDGFKNIVDALGGVTLYVPEDMEYNDPDQGLYINLKKGEQTLDGAKAEQFVRFRSGWVQADLGRINAQKIFLTAMFNQVKAVIKNLDVPAISNMATEVFKNVYTDMSVSDIIYFAKHLVNVDLESINMTTIPGNMAGSFYVTNREATLNVINQYFNIYYAEITDSIFDKSKLFCNLASTEACNVYFGDPEDILDGVYNADDINKDSIDIPSLNK